MLAHARHAVRTEVVGGGGCSCGSGGGSGCRSRRRVTVGIQVGVAESVSRPSAVRLQEAGILIVRSQRRSARIGCLLVGKVVRRADGSESDARRSARFRCRGLSR